MELDKLRFINYDSKSLCNKLNTFNFGDKNLLMPSYYGNVVFNSNDYFPMLSERCSKVLAMKLLDLIIKEHADGSNFEEVVGRNISERELAGLQYLGGYVFQRLYKRVRQLPNYRSELSQKIMSLLLAGKSEGQNLNLKLVNALDRGGLWHINDDVQKLFVVCEKYFSYKTTGKSSKININAITHELTKCPFIKETFSSVVRNSELKPSEEAIDSTLYNIIRLYIQVRSFSYCRDIVNRCKLKSNKKEKGGLRKNLKNLSKKNLPTTDAD